MSLVIWEDSVLLALVGDAEGLREGGGGKEEQVKGILVPLELNLKYNGSSYMMKRQCW